jgi:flavorubredoxin
MGPIELKKNIYWVGAIDWNIRDFHGYSTYKGTSYNTFLLVDEKIVLFDTVKKPFHAQLVKNIRHIVDPSRIDYVVINHAEMDHSGCLPEVMEMAKPEKLICSPACKKAIIDHFHREDWPFEIVKTGDSMSLGKKNIEFIETKMLHWPDSMFSYLKEDRILISSDAFGQHWATSERFDDEVDNAELLRHAAKYYGNILLPYSSLVQKLLAAVKQMGLAIDLIATDHGLMWRKNPSQILDAYDRWSRQEADKKALVIYDTMWESTARMASAVAEGLKEAGLSVQVMDLKKNHRSEIMTEVMNARVLVFGSPTLNQGMMPTMADVLSYMKGLKPVGKIGAAFGSYGWGGEAPDLIRGLLEDMKIKVIEPVLKIKYVPKPEDLTSCLEFGKKIAAAALESYISV